MVDCDRCHRKFANYAALKQHYSNQHPNAKWPVAFDSKLVEEKNVQDYKEKLRPSQRSYTKLIIGVVLIVIAVGALGAYLPTLFQTQANSTCANFPFPPIGIQELSEHYHAILKIFVNGQEVSIPANVGEGDSGPCTQPLHVHASDPGTNVIHIETPQERTYTLGEFFRIWAATPDIGGPTPVVFNQNQIFSYNVGNGYELRMFVNGQQSTAYDSLVIQAHMTILLVYGNASTDWSSYQGISGQPWPYPDL